MIPDMQILSSYYVQKLMQGTCINIHIRIFINRCISALKHYVILDY